MPKATRAKETTTTPKKRGRKAASENGSEVQLDQPITTSPELAAESAASPLLLEEKIRVRAYELFLQRNGRGGSPEQDWFQAIEEIAGHNIA